MRNHTRIRALRSALFNKRTVVFQVRAYLGSFSENCAKRCNAAKRTAGIRLPTRRYRLGPVIAACQFASFASASVSLRLIFCDDASALILWFKVAVKRSGVRYARFHDLRVFALHAMEMAGLPRSLATTISGHKTECVYLRYAAIFLDSELEDAGAQLSAHHKKSAKSGPTTVPISSAGAKS